MFDIGWSEMAVIALIALIVIGPKELPKAMRSVAKWARKARSLAREFQSGVDDMIREADLDDARQAFDATKTFDIGKALEDTVDPTGSLREEAKELRDTAQSAGSSETEVEEPGAGETTGGAPPEPEAGEATVVEHPVAIAPPHSLTPPPEEGAAPAPAPAEEEAAVADGDGSGQRA